ncbi:MAG TPA: GDSL-type esterase/lipase family protein, partial [Candidatus Sulfopaludibacter sp.]|nr:GDSL-type esterase/lipase family protein [Candidatus Sulfopaludibacter sp.]
MRRLFLASLTIYLAAAQSQAPDPAPRTGAWMKRHEQNVERIAQGGVDLLMIGDSITQNYEKANPPNEDFKPTWDRFYAPRHAVNLGISGDTTANVLWRLQHGEIDGVHPKAAVILIGTNDTGHGATAEPTEAGIDAIIRLVHEKCPTTKILLLAILPSR